MRKTMAVHVRYNSLYISLPSSAKQQREMGDPKQLMYKVKFKIKN